MSEYSEPPPYDDGRRTGWAELPAGGTVKLASPAARFGARMFDLFVVFVINSVIWLTNVDWNEISGQVQEDTPDFSGIAPGAWVWWVQVLIWFFYETGSVALWGRTLGKRIAGIRVVNAQNGAIPGWGKAIGRWAVPGIPAAQPFIWPVGALWFILCNVSLTWDRVYQGWHDKAAGTLVIKV